MAQAAAMGPPLSPREIRRSGRRSAPSASTSASKSPDSDLPRQKDAPHRPQVTSNNNNQRHKRPKQEDMDETVDERSKSSAAPSISSVGPPPSTTNNRTKRKAKEKDKQPLRTSAAGESNGGADEVAGESQEEEQGITRCVCGTLEIGEDDQDAGEFMVQCETCKVWQHGLCMGFESEDQLHDDDYYCELCKPSIHADLLKKLSKRVRQSSTTSHHNASASAPSRASRSHSPSHLLKQPSKRRNTMNSRDAAFDESLKEIIEATAAEAAAHDPATLPPAGSSISQPEHGRDVEEANNRKKRKRTEDEPACAIPKKRTRSLSTASDRPVLSTEVRAETPGGQGKAPPQAPAPPSKPPRNKRGSRKVAAQENIPSVEGDEVAPPPPKRQANNSRTKTANAPKRPPASHNLSHGPGSSAHDHGTRRNQNTSGNGQPAGSSAAEASRAYRNSHAYVVSQQPLFTSWNLPDYLAHLEEMLPTDTPQPLEVRAGFAVGSAVGAPNGRSESLERTMERGVKVKWPSKRMSVGDMNKRVRALVEWVGREQASALDRLRRREALEKAMVDESFRSQAQEGIGQEPRDSDGHDASRDAAMILDWVPSSESPIQEKTVGQAMHSERPSALIHQPENVQSSATMRMMEELMEELIGFQERFGPGAKSRDRERRPTATAAA
ncbi:hypothetical protein BD779DRAFT_1435743 [Infundibulicybe gibba]|nr:hypothetical protein BD779DRAFT_1435743 [Infundibulicybe gibba]